jgi:carboxypeptidase Taq
MVHHYEQLVALLREGAVLSSAAHLLNWDQETMMPPAAAPARAEELALLARLAHERLTHPGIEELLDGCDADPELAADERTAANLREIRRDYERARKLPAELVAEISLTNSKAMEAWKRARDSRDYGIFCPWMEKQIDLNRRKADCYGLPEGGERYDALLEEYEPGMTAARLEEMFEPLRVELIALIAEITASGRQPSQASQQVSVAQPLQHELNLLVLKRLGIDLDASRLDTSVHPFSTGIAPGDTRITTRYQDGCFADSLGSTLHEAGHALYEQGLPKRRHWGEPLGEAMGMGTHESQSRLWENHVGRSRVFWQWALPQVRKVFGSAMDSFDVDDLYGAVNAVRPNLIRVESDEATYNLHIMLRFDLERALLRGDLAAADLPHAWNERMRQDLGLEVPDDTRGCMQDIHWSMGAIGYFPTYTLGNLYAAQYWEAINGAIDDLEVRIASGDFSALLDWLRENIHAHGRRYHAEELCRALTGSDLHHAPLVNHLRTKYADIYAL